MKKTFIEIGSGADGSWGVDLLHQGWRGYFVEPHPGNLIQLQETLIHKEQIDSDQFHLMNFGIWEDHGIQAMNSKELTLKDIGISFHINGSDPFYMKPSRSERPISMRFYIACVTLSDLLNFTGNPQRIRMDIEGSEIPVLMCHIWDYVPEELSVEFHSHLYIDDVTDTLKKQNFVCLNYNRLEFTYGTPSTEQRTKV